jgi:4-hydroxy-2-oxoheptanedioate aldolase
LEKVLAACQRTGKVPGIAATTLADARRRIEQGFRFVTASGDLGLMLTAAREGLTMLRS